MKVSNHNELCTESAENSLKEFFYNAIQDPNLKEELFKDMDYLERAMTNLHLNGYLTTDEYRAEQAAIVIIMLTVLNKYFK